MFNRKFSFLCTYVFMRYETKMLRWREKLKKIPLKAHFHKNSAKNYFKPILPHICVQTICRKSFLFSNFSCMFLNPNIFFQFEFNCSNLLDMRNLKNKLKKQSVAKNCSGLSLFEWIVLVISKILKILGLQPQISKVFLNH